VRLRRQGLLTVKGERGLVVAEFEGAEQRTRVW
jgi:hypothetical protein